MPTVEVLNDLDLSDLIEDLTAQLSREDIKDFIISLLESIDLNGDEIREIKDTIGEY